MTDAFTKFSVAVTTNNQQALTVAKALVERWFHVYGIPARIHSDQGKSFNNKIIDPLCKMYGVERTMTSPYNPRGNSQCERFNRTMFGLLKPLTKEQKGDWPAHLPVLTFAYNATPHSTTGYQPYELMFGRRAPTPCDNWLGLRQYNDDKSISKVIWVDKQFEKIVKPIKERSKVFKQGQKSTKGRQGIKISTFLSKILFYFATIRKAGTKFKMTTSRIYLRSLVNIPTQMHFRQALRRKGSG